MTVRSVGTVGLVACVDCGAAFRLKWTPKDGCPVCGAPFDREEVF